MKKSFVAGLMFSTMLGMSSPAQADNIFEALSQTYNTNPTLQAQRAYLRGIDENVAIAKSGFRPTIALNAGYNDANKNSDIVSMDGSSEQGTLAATISQPIFNSFSTVNSVRSADSLVRAEQNNLYNVEQTVFLDASTAYLDVVRDMAIVELQKNNEELLKKRLDETRQRFKVGEVTRTDVSQAEARYSQARSDRISSEGTLQASKATYLKLIGSKPENLEEPKQIKDFLPKTFEEALQVAMGNNYTIQQAKHILKAKDYNISANTGALGPQVSLDGTASKVKNKGDNYDGRPETDNYEWSVNLSLPLYNGGESRAKIRQSKYEKWQAQEQVLEAERSVHASVSSAWEYMQSNNSKIFAIIDQVKANQIALDGVQKEEALGNRTILDVLDAYQELLNSEVEEVKARRNYYVSAMSLLQAMGKLTARDLKLGVDLYNAKKYYKETRDKWLSLN